MCLQTVLAVFSTSLALIVTQFLGAPGCSGLATSIPVEKSLGSYEDPFEAPRLFGCDSKDVKPGKYMVSLKQGYPLEQHIETIGRGLNSSISWVSSFGDFYVASFNKTTLTAVLEDLGVSFVECDAYIESIPTIEL